MTPTKRTATRSRKSGRVKPTAEPVASNGHGEHSDGHGEAPPDGSAPPAAKVEKSTIPCPVYRKLRGYAFDPSLSVHLDTAVINEIVYKVDWEADLLKGPVGKYIEVVDYDPASESFYAPVDLNDSHILGQDGLAPSEGNPQFHQQMVYAVMMTTIRNFERALGRPALWAPRLLEQNESKKYEFVERLRVYPHALREANAYYSPDKKALLFGYFPASADSPERYLPGGIVFSCLSHDIIAHETTHALLDGMYDRFNESNHRDTFAFHEAFADIVALFQHFTFPEVLRHQIARTRGDLSSQNLLGELAQQFGEAIGNYGALRDAIGEVDKETGKWKPHDPKPEDYENTIEPHARGAILVAAVFDAFLSIYKSRVSDLLRIASSGTGILEEGALHPDLVNRLASEASKAAQHVLNACIRALDYCPPVDINFGDYLRGIITADTDLVPDDDRGYRIAFIEAFRRRGIYPRDVRTLSPESLRWPVVSGGQQKFFEPLAENLRRVANEFMYFKTRGEIYETTNKVGGWLNGWIKDEGYYTHLEEFGRLAGIAFKFGLPGLRGTPPPKGNDMVPKFQIHSLRPARRVGPDGNSLNQLIISIIQTRNIEIEEPGEQPLKFKFRGGSTLVLDLATMELRYAISKDVTDEDRLDRHTRYHRGVEIEGSSRATYFRHIKNSKEPFALLHRSLESEVP